MARENNYNKLLNLFKYFILYMLLEKAVGQLQTITDRLKEQEEHCIGKHQIPFNAKGKIQEYRKFPRMQFKNFDSLPDNTTWANNGYSLEINMKFKKSPPTISGGPIENAKINYRLLFIYFHFMHTSYRPYNYGNLTFPAELHMIFCDEKYEELVYAFSDPQSVVVLAFGLQIMAVNDSFLDMYANDLDNITERYTRRFLPIDKILPLSSFMPEDLMTYVFYRGSMMKFTCLADVLWVDFQDPIIVTPNFVTSFQKLEGDLGKPLLNDVFAAKHLPEKVLIPYHMQGKFAQTNGGEDNYFFCPFKILFLICVIFKIFNYME